MLPLAIGHCMFREFGPTFAIMSTMKTCLFLSLLCFAFFSNAQKDEDPIQVLFYNVENLFDTLDDPHTSDNEFLPDSKKQWATSRYQDKLSALARVIREGGNGRCPDIIGLCEVENKKVVEDLALTLRTMAGIDFELMVVHEESPDVRGIDVAFIYRPEAFAYEAHKTINIDLSSIEEKSKTRDILHVNGKIWNTDVHFFINHWSSRRGGLAASEPKRVICAETLKANIEEVTSKDPNARVVVMGDLNDETDNKSVSEIVMGVGHSGREDLVNLMAELDKRGRGTYNYRGNWNMLDQFIVSNEFLFQQKVYIDPSSIRIVSAPWMLYEDPKYGMKPSRTYGGPNYYGGFSDHLPIFLEIQLHKN